MKTPHLPSPREVLVTILAGAIEDLRTGRAPDAKWLHEGLDQHLTALLEGAMEATDSDLDQIVNLGLFATAVQQVADDARGIINAFMLARLTDLGMQVGQNYTGAMGSATIQNRTVSTIDRVKLLTAGVDEAIVNAATTTKPSAPFLVWRKPKD